MLIFHKILNSPNDTYDMYFNINYKHLAYILCAYLIFAWLKSHPGFACETRYNFEYSFEITLFLNRCSLL